MSNPLSQKIAGTDGHALIYEGKLYFKAAKVAGADGQKPWTKPRPAPPLGDAGVGDLPPANS